MAATQQYSLRWNNYFRHLTYALENHRAENDFVDVTLICDARKIKAHKVVLSSCSAYFKEIFKENPHPHPVIIFKFIKYDDLNAIIEFMYQGEVNVQQEALQSFLQTAELLAVQGLTAEDKEKPKVPLPLIDEQKVIKTIPSTIRPITEAATGSQPTTQPVEIPPSTLNTLQSSSQHHVIPTQLQHLQVQQSQPQAIQISSAHSLQPVVTHQTPHVSAVTANTVTVPTVSLPAAPIVPVSLPSAPIPDLSLPTGAIGTVPATTRKRKITFTGEDENLYATETVDFQVKQEQNLDKPNEIPYMRGPVKMDIPEYIVSDVDEHITESATTQNSQDSSANETNPNVSQYANEYEILEEQDMDEKYNQSDADNSELIEMGRLLNQSGSSSGNHNNPNDPHRSHDIKTKIEPPSTDVLSNKWTECQFCKMIITTVNLWRHIRTQHTPQPPRKCELCNKNFKNKYSLREHIRISHEQKIPGKPEN